MVECGRPPGLRLLRKYMCWNEPVAGEFKRAKELRGGADRGVTARTFFQQGIDMSGITTSNLMINGISAQTLSENATTEREQAKQAGEALGPLSISSDSMKVSAGSQAQPTDSEDSGESEAVTELRQLIKDLQKQLVEEQKQLAALQNSKMDDAAKAAAVGAKQASIATINGQIMAATAQLLELLQQEGGSSSGGMVSATA